MEDVLVRLAPEGKDLVVKIGYEIVKDPKEADVVIKVGVTMDPLEIASIIDDSIKQALA